MRSRLPLFLLVLLIASGPAVAAGYSVSPDETTDVPTRTVTFEGQEFDISTIGRVAQGTQMTMTVSAPEDAEYTVLLYNTDEEKLNSATKTGSSRVAFSTDPLDPGTYGIVVSDSDSRTQAIQPVVVEGYDISLDSPGSFDADTAGEFSVSVAATASSGEPESVGVALTNGSWDKHVEADRVSNGEYEAHISVPSAGEYRVYAAARGTETIYNRREALAITGTQSVEVTETSDGGSGGGSGGLGGGSDDGGSETTQTTTENDGTTTTSDDDTTTSTSETTTTDDGAIAPNTTTESSETTAASETTTSPGTPGFTLSIAVAVVLGVALALRRGDTF